MTVSLSKRSIINLNSAGTQEYEILDIQKLGTIFAAASDFAGPYVESWSGAGTVQFAWEAPAVSFTVNDALSTSYVKSAFDRITATDPRIVFSWDSGQPLRAFVAIRFFGFSAPTNYQIFRLEDEADLLAGRIWRRGCLRLYANLNPSAVRTMNQFGGNESNLMRWEHRALPTDANWIGFANLANTPIYGTTSGTNIYTLAAIGSTPASEQHGYVVQCTIGTGTVRAGQNTVTGVTRANPGVATYSGTDNYQNGDKVIFRVFTGMTELNYRICTVANVNTGAKTFELSGLNTSGFTAWTAGDVMQYVSLQLGTWGAYPVIFSDGTSPAAVYGVYISTNDTKAFYFDKSLVAAKNEATGANIQGAWIFNGLGSNPHNAGLPPAALLARHNELNGIAQSLGKGPIDWWCNIPIRSMLSMDDDYSAASNVAIKTVNLFLNGGDGIAAAPSNTRIFIELSNETWNPGFTQSAWCSRRSQLRWGGGGSNPHTFHALRHAVMVSDIRAAFPNDLARIVFVIAGQGAAGPTGNISRIDGDATLFGDSLYNSLPGGASASVSYYYDAFAMASYLSADTDWDAANLSTYVTAWVNGNAAQKTQAITDYLAGAIGTGSGETLTRYRDSLLPAYNTKMASLNRAIIGYEGGNEFNVNGSVTDTYNFVYACKASQQWATYYRTWYDKWNALSNAFMPGEYIIIQGVLTDHRWDHIKPGYSDTYANGVEGGSLDPALDEITDYNNPETDGDGTPSLSTEEVARLSKFNDIHTDNEHQNLTVRMLLGSVERGITAHAGGGWASAYQLSANVNLIETVASSGDSVRLPSPMPGMELTVINAGSNPCRIYGFSSSHTIDGVAAGTGGVLLTNAKRSIFYGINSSSWASLMNAAAS